MIAIFALIFTVIFGWIAWKNRPWAIAVLLFLLPTYLIRFQIFGIPSTILEVLILVLFIVFCIQERQLFHFQQMRTFLSSRQNRLLVMLVAIFLIAGIFGLLTTPDLHAGIGIFKAYMIEPVLFFVVLINTIKTEQAVHRVIWALGLSATLIAVVSIIQYLTGWGIPEPWVDWPGRRATAFYGYPNAVGLFLAPITVLFIGGVLHILRGPRNRQARMIAFMIILFCVLGMIAAQAHGALVSVVGAFCVLLLFPLRRDGVGFTRLRRSGIALAAFGILLLISLPQTRNILLLQDVAGRVRLALWKGTFRLLAEQPLFGSGLGGFPATYDIYRLPSHVELLLYPHNIFLDFWVELGIVGLLWLIVVIIGFFVVARRLLVTPHHGYALSLIGVIVAVLLYGLVDVPYFKNDLSVLFWTWLALLVILSSFNQSAPKRSQDEL